MQQRKIAFLARQRVQRQRTPAGDLSGFLRLCQRRGKGFQPLQRLLRRGAMNHKPFLIDALSGQGGNGLLLRQNIFWQGL